MFKNRLEEIAKSLIDFDDDKRCHHFSFILLKKRIIAIGVNYRKTHPLNLKNKVFSKWSGLDFSATKYTCSEFNAITKLKRMTNIDTKKCVLVNIRLDRKLKKVNSKPCKSCQNLLRFFSFKKIYWTNEEGKFVQN